MQTRFSGTLKAAALKLELHVQALTLNVPQMIFGAIRRGRNEFCGSFCGHQSWPYNRTVGYPAEPMHQLPAGLLNSP
jgi:hypothetical protein